MGRRMLDAGLDSGFRRNDGRGVARSLFDLPRRALGTVLEDHAHGVQFIA